MKNRKQTIPTAARIVIGVFGGAAILLVVARMATAMQYEYDSLNRLTKVTYDDGRIVTYTYDEVGNRLRKIVTGTPTVPMDFNGDGDVDPDDFAIFDSCFSGPAIPHNGTPNCVKADTELDSDVDQSDFGIFQRCYSGQGIPSDPGCGN